MYDIILFVIIGILLIIPLILALASRKNALVGVASGLFVFILSGLIYVNGISFYSGFNNTVTYNYTNFTYTQFQNSSNGLGVLQTQTNTTIVQPLLNYTQETNQTNYTQYDTLTVTVIAIFTMLLGFVYVVLFWKRMREEETLDEYD